MVGTDQATHHRSRFGKAIVRAPESKVQNAPIVLARALGRLHNADGRLTSITGLLLRSLQPDDAGNGFVPTVRDRLFRAGWFPGQAL